jgi:anti-sigma regulatory factor (Ser/Thr protein kinase)
VTDALELVIPAESAELRALRRRIDVWAGPYLPESVLQDLQIAITEACANAVVHSGTQEIRISVRLVDSCVDVVVEDDGIYRELLSSAEDDSDAHRGLALMAALVDDLTLYPGTESRAGTTVRMRKCLA